MKPKSIRAASKIAQNRAFYMEALVTNSKWEGELSEPIVQSRNLLSRHPIILPSGWRDHSLHALQRCLSGIVSKEVLETNDLFLCSLIHPSYIHSRHFTEPLSPKDLPRVRNEIAMPGEAMALGSSTLQLLQSLLEFHHSVGQSSIPVEDTSLDHQQTRFARPKLQKIDVHFMKNVPKQLELESLLLYDDTLLSSRDGSTPTEVLVSATTALCGSAVLRGGPSLAARLLDRVS